MGSPATYTAEVDTQLDGTYGGANDDISEYVLEASWSVGMEQPYQEVANPSQAYLTLDNRDGRFDVERSGATFEGLLTPGMLLRISMTYSGSQQMWEGRIATVKPLVGAKEAQPWVQVRCIDLLWELGQEDFAPDLDTDLLTSEALAAVFDKAPVAYPYAARWWALGIAKLGEGTYLYNPTGFKSFETGKSTIAYAGAVSDVGDGMVSAMSYIHEIVDQECGGRFFWNGRDHTFTFQNRHHDLLNVSNGVDATIVIHDIQEGGIEPMYGDDVVNRVVLRWTPKATGATNSLLYEADNVPFTLRPDQTRRIQARFRDPNNPDVKVAAETVIQPLLGTHVTTDDNDSISMAVDMRANVVIFEITNVGAGDVSVTAVTVRGTPLYTYNPEEIIKVDADSIGLYGKRGRTYSRKIQNQDDAEGFAQYQLNTFKDAKVRIDKLLIPKVETADEAGWAKSLTVGSAVKVDDSYYSGHVANYVIVGERHHVTEGWNHDVTYTVRRQDKAGGWLIGQAGFSELGETTFLVL